MIVYLKTNLMTFTLDMRILFSVEFILCICKSQDVTRDTYPRKKIASAFYVDCSAIE